MPPTLHLDATNPADMARAADLLRSGHLVAFATETVYGLGASALDEQAVAGIFAAKQRPAWDPLIVHLGDVSQLPQVAKIPAEHAQRIAWLARHFWPGPLTLLLPKSAAVPDVVTAGRPLVGVRIPAHPAARALLREAGVPIAAPSANRFGHTSPTTAAHVLSDLDGRIDAVLDAGPAGIGVESTVLDPTQTPMMIYRPGAVTVEQLEEVTGVPVTLFTPVVTEEEPQSLPSPGVGIRHYAPRARVLLVSPEGSDISQMQMPEEGPLGVLLPEGWAAPSGALVFDWGPWQQPETLAARLYAGLRELDDRNVAVILAPLPPRGGLNDALRDRLEKAARAT